MTTKWANNSSQPPDFGELFKEKFAVVLLRGKNSFGDHIYSYVKITFPNFKRMYDSMMANDNFMPSDFGEVIAAGTGEPSEELKAEIAAQYPMIGNKPSGAAGASASAPPPPQNKAWDEY